VVRDREVRLRLVRVLRIALRVQLGEAGPVNWPAGAWTFLCAGMWNMFVSMLV
jgi:hypothetical protein